MPGINKYSHLFPTRWGAKKSLLGHRVRTPFSTAIAQSPPPGLGLQGHPAPSSSSQEVIWLQREPGPVTPCSEAFGPTSASLHDNPGSLYLARGPNTGLRASNLGSEGHGQVPLLVKLPASPLGLLQSM